MTYWLSKQACRNKNKKTNEKEETTKNTTLCNKLKQSPTVEKATNMTEYNKQKNITGKHWCYK